MPRIATLSLDQINRQIDTLDSLQSQLAAVQKRVANIGNQVITADPFHAPPTTNNMVFTWTGGTTTLSWVAGYLKDKNWSSQTTTPVPAISSVPGVQHFFAIPAGSLTLSASTTYWLAWDPDHQTMRATADASSLHGDEDIHIICQLTTGSASQTGVAGGGGSHGGTDLSGTVYNNFNGPPANTIVGSTSGLLIQSGGPVGAGTTNFPVAFSATPAVVLGNIHGSVDLDSGSITNSGFSLSVSASSTAYWIAIGPK